MSLEELTPRQRQIVELMAQGLGTGEIAQQLGLAAGNVSMQKTLLKRRLGVTSDAEVLAKIEGGEQAPAFEPPRFLYFNLHRGPGRTLA